MTQPSIAQVEAAVRSVLLEVKGGASKGNGRGGEVFAERLLSLRHAEALPAGTREVRIVAGTVITPLAREYLKRQGIESRVVSRSGGENGRSRGEWAFAIETESGAIAALRRAWLEDRDPWIEISAGSEATARWVTEGSGRGALLVTDDAAIAVWKSCRFEGVRAASACDVDSVARAVRGLGVNLLAVEPSGKPLSLLKQMGLEFRRRGAPDAPVWLVETEAPCGSPK